MTVLHHRCSRCGALGHNVRTCERPEPKADTIVRVRLDKERLQRRVDALNEALSCSHVEDNQGLCHRCGVKLNDDRQP